MMRNIAGIALLIFGLNGCAQATRTQAVYNATSEDLYAKCIAALVRSGYQINYTDKDAKIINASRAIKNLVTERESRPFRVTLLINGDTTGAKVDISWAPPEWSFGTVDEERRELEDAISHELKTVVK